MSSAARLLAPDAPARRAPATSAPGGPDPAGTPKRVAPGAEPRAATHAARSALRTALAAFGGTQLRGAHDSQEIDRWADDGGSLGHLYAGARRVRARERRAWEAHEFARDRVYRAVGAYARALDGDRVSLPAALAAMRTAVAETDSGLAAGVLAAVQRDAAQGCVDAFAGL